MLNHVEELMTNHSELEVCVKILGDIMDLLYNAECVVSFLITELILLFSEGRGFFALGRLWLRHTVRGAL